MEVVRACETLANFCPNSCVCRDVPKKIFYIHMHTYIYTHAHSPLQIYIYPPKHPTLQTYTDTHNTQNFSGVIRADMSTTGKNVLNIRKENVSVFRWRARKLYTDGDVRELRGVLGPLVWQTCSTTLFLEVHISLNFMYSS